MTCDVKRDAYVRRTALRYNEVAVCGNLLPYLHNLCSLAEEVEDSSAMQPYMLSISSGNA